MDEKLQKLCLVKLTKLTNREIEKWRRQKNTFFICNREPKSGVPNFKVTIPRDRLILKINRKIIKKLKDLFGEEFSDEFPTSSQYTHYKPLHQRKSISRSPTPINSSATINFDLNDQMNDTVLLCNDSDEEDVVFVEERTIKSTPTPVIRVRSPKYLGLDPITNRTENALQNNCPKLSGEIISHKSSQPIYVVIRVDLPKTSQEDANVEIQQASTNPQLQFDARYLNAQQLQSLSQEQHLLDHSSSMQPVSNASLSIPISCYSTYSNATAHQQIHPSESTAQHLNSFTNNQQRNHTAPNYTNINLEKPRTVTANNSALSKMHAVPVRSTVQSTPYYQPRIMTINNNVLSNIQTVPVRSTAKSTPYYQPRTLTADNSALSNMPTVRERPTSQSTPYYQSRTLAENDNVLSNMQTLSPVSTAHSSPYYQPRTLTADTSALSNMPNVPERSTSQSTPYCQSTTLTTNNSVLSNMQTVPPVSTALSTPHCQPRTWTANNSALSKIQAVPVRSTAQSTPYYQPRSLTSNNNVLSNMQTVPVRSTAQSTPYYQSRPLTSNNSALSNMQNVLGRSTAQSTPFCQPLLQDRFSGQMFGDGAYSVASAQQQNQQNSVNNNSLYTSPQHPPFSTVESGNHLQTGPMHGGTPQLPPVAVDAVDHFLVRMQPQSQLPDLSDISDLSDILNPPALNPVSNMNETNNPPAWY